MHDCWLCDGCLPVVAASPPCWLAVSTIYCLILVKLFLDLFELIVQRIKYKPAMYVRRQLQAVAAYFGLTFESDWLDSPIYSRMVSIPESYANPLQDQESNVRGFFTPNKQEQLGYFNGTAYDLINELKSIFDVIYQGNVIPLISLVFLINLTPSYDSLITLSL
jgi:hypothetical protein